MRTFIVTMTDGTTKIVHADRVKIHDSGALIFTIYDPRQTDVPEQTRDDVLIRLIGPVAWTTYDLAERDRKGQWVPISGNGHGLPKGEHA